MKKSKTISYSSLLLTFLIGISVGTLAEGVRADIRGSAIFPDVEQGAYFDDAVGTMYNLGVITGYQDGRFGPNDYVTRGQVAVMMDRFKDSIGTVTSSSSSVSRRTRSSSSSSSSESSSSRNTTLTDAGAFEFSLDSFDISEGASRAMVSVMRVNGDSGTARVSYKTVSETAEEGQDFTANSGQLSFADGETIKTISVTIKNDDDSEDTESFKIELSEPTAGAILNRTDTITINIIDNDKLGNLEDSSSSTSSVGEAGEQGILGFSADQYSFLEKDGTITIRVIRTEGSKGEVSVKYATSHESPTKGADYNSTSGTLTFADGDTEETFVIQSNDNDSIGGNKKIIITLSDPTGGAIVPEPNSEVIINDDEIMEYTNGEIRFDKDEYEIAEDEVAKISIMRFGGTNGDITVEFTTQNGTAKSGSDYTSVSKTITFKEGESSHIISIPILKDSNMESTETAQLIISAPTGGATLGNPSTSQISILNK